MADQDRNRRTAGFKRVNAGRERLRMKEADRRAADGHRAAALVVLSSSIPHLDRAAVEAAVERVFPHPGNVVVTGPVESAAELQTPDGERWCLLWAEGSYFDDGIPTIPVEGPLSEALNHHAGYLIVERVRPEPTGPALGPRLGQLVAALAGPDAQVLLQPGSSRVVPYSEAVAAALAAGDLERVWETETTRRSGKNAASTEATQRFPEFLTAFAQRQPDDMFAVKLRFEDEHGAEDLWVNISSIDDTAFHGRLDSDPVQVRSLRRGDDVRADRDRLCDWLFLRNGRLFGGFTVATFGGPSQLRLPPDA